MSDIDTREGMMDERDRRWSGVDLESIKFNFEIKVVSVMKTF